MFAVPIFDSYKTIEFASSSEPQNLIGTIDSLGSRFSMKSGWMERGLAIFLGENQSLQGFYRIIINERVGFSSSSSTICSTNSKEIYWASYRPIVSFILRL